MPGTKKGVFSYTYPSYMYIWMPPSSSIAIAPPLLLSTDYTHNNIGHLLFFICKKLGLS